MEYLVHEAGRKLTNGDISMAISEYEDAKGRLPEVIIIHPKNDKLAGEVPEDIRVEYGTNPLKSEVWFPVYEYETEKRWPEFDASRDRAIIEAGGFFCHGCLVGKPLDDISEDPRYCMGCQELKKGDVETPPDAVLKESAPDNGCAKTNLRESYHPDDTQGVVLAHPGGRPNAQLPMKKISILVGKGLTSRNIATQLGLPHRTTHRAVKKLQQPLLAED